MTSPANPQPGNRDEQCRCRNLTDEDMPPSARIGDTAARRRGLMNTRGCALHHPPSAVQDTERLREDRFCICGHPFGDHNGRCHYNRQVYGSGFFCDCASYRDDSDSPLRHLIAERDEARAAVQRVETVLTTWPQFHGKCECGTDHLLREIVRALDNPAP